MAKIGEPWRFGLDADEAESFLRRYGFTLVNQASPAELERRYLTDAEGRLHGRINGTQGLVTARKP